jgi:hypothetical protein
VIKRYHAPATPYERALTHPKLSNAIKRRLRETYRSLDPVALLAEIRRCQDELGARIARRGLAAAADGGPADPLAFARALATNASTGEVRATHRRVKRKYKTRMRMPSKLDPHLATIEHWLKAEPQITALAILRRLAAIDPDTFCDKQHSIVQRLLKALRRKAAHRVIAETTTEGGEAKLPNAGVGGPAVGLRPPSGPPTPPPLQPHHQRSAPAASGNSPP